MTEPDTFACTICDRVAHIDERHGGRDTDPGYWCDDCSVDPGWAVRRG